MKPYLIIDIDGTLRPHPAGESVDPSAAVTILPAQADQLRSMSDRYELVWATMRDHAVSLQLALGLGVSFQTIALAWDDAGSRSLNHKTAQVARWVTIRGSRPFVWADDLITDTDRQHLAGLRLIGPHLLIGPNPEIGLTFDDWARIGQWSGYPATPMPPSRRSRLSRWRRT